MNHKQLPSDRYFEVVQNEEDYLKFKGSGMAWEWEPHTPNSWDEHLSLKAVWLAHKLFDGS